MRYLEYEIISSKSEGQTPCAARFTGLTQSARGFKKTLLAVAALALLPAIGLGQSILLTPGTINTIAGTGSSGEAASGTSATTATLQNVYAVAVAPYNPGSASGGDIYFSESTNYVKVIYEGGAAAQSILSALGYSSPVVGDVYTIAGNGNVGTSGIPGTEISGTVATSSKIVAPKGLAVDSYGNLFLSNDIVSLNGEASVQVLYAGTVNNQGTNPAAALISLEDTNITSPVAGDLYYVAGGIAAGSGWANAGIAWKVPLTGARGIYVNSYEDIYIASNAGNGSTGGEVVAVWAGNTSSPLYTLLDAQGYTGAALVAGDGYILAGGYSSTTYANDYGEGVDGSAGGGHDQSSYTGTTYENGPISVGADTAGNVYVAESGANKIRKISVSTGQITTIGGTTAGNATPAYSLSTAGDGGLSTAASFGTLSGLWVDSGGAVYFADGNGSSPVSSSIRKIDANGYISTIAGTLGTGSSSGTNSNGDGGNSTAATFNAPVDVKLDSNGNLYIADQADYKIREVTVNTAAAGTIGDSATSSGSLAFGTITFDNSSSPATALVSNITSSPITLSKVVIPWGYMQVASGSTEAPDCNTSTAISAGTSCTLELKFTPTANGTYDDNVTVAAGSDTVTLPVTGTGTEAPTSTTSTTLSVSPNSGPYEGYSPITFTATVTPSTATGTVTFIDADYGTLGTVTLNGGQAIFQETTQFGVGSHSVMVAYNGSSSYAGSISSSASLTIVAPPAPTVTISANPQTITTGNTATLTWSSTDASSCTASVGWPNSQVTSGVWGGTVATSGSQQITQWATNNYTVTCTGLGGQSSNSVVVASPQINISANSSGVQQFTIGEEPFVPIGVNYLIDGSGTYDSSSYNTFDMFDSQTFNRPAIDSQLAQIAADGYTYVRLWLKGIDTDNGFVINGEDTWSAYVLNIVHTIEDAESNGLHVVLTGSFPGPTGTWLVPLNYQPSGSPPSNVAGYNEMFLWPAMTSALGQYFNDLTSAMLSVDPDISTGIFYFDLYNEAKYDTNQAPLSLSSGTITYNSVTYDLSDFNTDDTTDPNSRQAMLDVATTNFMQIVGGAVLAQMPNVLITASSFNNYAENHTAFDGGVPNKSNYYALRPYYMLKGGGNIIDLHSYPSETSLEHVEPGMISNELIPVSTTPTGTLINATIAPFLAGEFGAGTSDYGVTEAGAQPPASNYLTGLNEALQQMNGTVTQQFCPYGYVGFANWEWNLLPTDTFVLIDTTDDPNYVFLQAMAPKYVPTLCGTTITP